MSSQKSGIKLVILQGQSEQNKQVQKNIFFHQFFVDITVHICGPLDISEDNLIGK